MSYLTILYQEIVDISMPNRLSRIIALLLVPCLVAEPAPAHIEIRNHRTIGGPSGSLADPQSEIFFASQALAPGELDFAPRGFNPFKTVWLFSAAASLAGLAGSALAHDVRPALWGIIAAAATLAFDQIGPWKLQPTGGVAMSPRSLHARTAFIPPLAYFNQDPPSHPLDVEGVAPRDAEELRTQVGPASETPGIQAPADESPSARLPRMQGTLADAGNSDAGINDPIEMVINNFKHGAQVVILGDPHPEIYGLPAYAEFLMRVVGRAIDEVSLRQVACEVPQTFMDKGLIPFIQRWISSGIKSLGEFQMHDGVSHSSWVSEGSRQILLMLRLAFENGLSLIGFDERPAWIVAGPEVDRSFYTALEQSIEMPVLMVAGTLHAAKLSSLPSMAALLVSDRHLNVRNVHVEVGLKTNDDDTRDIRRALQKTGLSMAAVDLLENSSFADMRIAEFPHRVTFDGGPFYYSKETVTSYGHDFNQLLYFRSNDAIEEYLQSKPAADAKRASRQSSASDDSTSARLVLLPTLLFASGIHYGNEPLALAGLLSLVLIVLPWLLPSSWWQAIRRAILPAALAVLSAGALAVRGWSAPPGQRAEVPAAAPAPDPTRNDALRTNASSALSPRAARATLAEKCSA